MTPLPAYALDEVRQAFPICQQLTYLNHASISPIPAPAQALMQIATDLLTRDPGAFFGPHPDPRLGDIFVTFAQAVADLINAASLDEIVGQQSTSAALNAVAQAIDWQPGDNIVFSRQEFPSNAYPWMSLAARGVECRIVPDDGLGGPTVDSLMPYVDSRTRLIAVSAVQFLSGHRADLAAIGAFCRAHQILLAVDAIQAAGHMPIDVQAMHIDILAAGGQKSLMGPPGQGFLYVHKDLAERLRPALIGPNATVGWEFWADYDISPREGALRFTMGTPNVIGMVGLTASIRYLLGLGLGHIDAWTRHLSTIAAAELSARGYTVITPVHPSLTAQPASAAAPPTFGPIVTFRVHNPDPADRDALRAADEDASALMNRMSARGVRLTKHWDARGVAHVRISPHCYNTEDEIRRVCAILEEHYG